MEEINIERYTCPICGNQDEKYFGVRNGKIYCRRCISFRGETVSEYKPRSGHVAMNIKYPLSKEQSEIANKVKENFLNGIDTLIDAVCGAGKTELIYEVMGAALSRGKTVAFAVPRRDVVIELLPRIKSVFPTNSITAVYGGHTSKLKADIVVLTTHQLYRYPHVFDLIILDEIDAFPFKDNDLLLAMLHNASRGRVVMMSATPSDDVLREFSQDGHDILHLNTRFHHKPLPVPQLIIRYGYLKLITLIRKLGEFLVQNKPVFVFCPTIDIAEKVFGVINKTNRNGNIVHSKKSDRSQIIEDFKNGKYAYLVTTAVLERGVTIKNLQVIIYEADHDLYDEHALIQISGRVGRKFDAPEGEVIFLADKNTEAIRRTISTIEDKNKSLQNML